MSFIILYLIRHESGKSVGDGRNKTPEKNVIII